MRREVIDPVIGVARLRPPGAGRVPECDRCATAWQAAVPRDSAIVWRIGIHQGDIVVEDGDIFGDGVNVAGRLKALAEPGGICVSFAFRRTRPDASTLCSSIWVSKTSRTLLGRCGRTGFGWHGPRP